MSVQNSVQELAKKLGILFLINWSPAVRELKKKLDIPFIYAWALFKTGCKKTWCASIRIFSSKYPIWTALIIGGVLALIGSTVKKHWLFGAIMLALGFFLGHLYG